MDNHKGYLRQGREASGAGIISMASKIEEDRLAEYMPTEFRERCPVCKQPWLVKSSIFHERYTSVSVGCKTSHPDRLDCFSFCQSIGFAPSQIETAYRRLWRSWVGQVGLKKAIDYAKSTTPLRPRWIEDIGKQYIEQQSKGTQECLSTNSTS